MKKIYIILCVVILYPMVLSAQLNDSYNNALFLEISDSCVVDTFDSSGAQTVIPEDVLNPSCGFYKGGDVWFTFVMPLSATARVEIRAVEGGINPQFSLYARSSDGLLELSCNQLNATKTYHNQDLMGDTIFVRVFNYDSHVGGEFSLCVYSVEAPENNFVSDAVDLSLSLACEMDTFTNRYATGDTSVLNPSCGFYKGGDVWFKSLVPESGVFRIETENIETNIQSAVYVGKADSLWELSCNQLNSEKTNYYPDLAGDSMYIRLFSYGSAEGGDFGICLWEPELPLNNLYKDAIRLAVPFELALDTFSNAYATNDTSAFIPYPSCGFFKGGDVWFKAEMLASGALRIESRSISMNPQSAIYAWSEGELIQVSCQQLDAGKTLHLPELAGDSLFIRLWNYNSEEGGEFSLGLWEPQIAMNDSCTHAIMLDVKTACHPDTFSNAYATAYDLDAPNPGCGFYKGGDVWFTFVLPDSGRVLIQRENIEAINVQWAVYSGMCGDFTVLSCAQLKTEMLIDEPHMAGDTLYLRAFSYNSDEGGRFSLCLTDPDCSILNIGTYTAGATIWANQDDASYQWINCADASVIEGAVQQSFEPATPGEYAVIVEQGSCMDTSACVQILPVGLQTLDAGVFLYPNPGKDKVRVAGLRAQLVEYELLDLRGRTMKKGFLHTPTLDISDLVEGNYILKLNSENGVSHLRFTKIK